MQEQKISVIVPVYNLEEYVSRCIRSILAQSHRCLEVIAVDDGSEDGSLALLQRLAREDSRLVVLHQENAGVTAARLRGVKAATGDWIGFVDGDDEIMPWMYGRLLEKALETGADIAHCGYRRVAADGNFEDHYNTGRIQEFDRETGLRELLREKSIEPGLCSKLYRRSLFAGLEDRMDSSIKNNEDMLMNFFLFSAAEKSIYEDVCPYLYFYRENSASRYKRSDHWIHDPVRVRRLIAVNAAGIVRTTAQEALLRTLLYKYAQLAMEEVRDYAGNRKELREQLGLERLSFRLLSFQNRILAELICQRPGVFRFLFRCYVKVFLGGTYR